MDRVYSPYCKRLFGLKTIANNTFFFNSQTFAVSDFLK